MKTIFVLAQKETWRARVGALLRAKGYRVIETKDEAELRSLLESGTTVDLVISPKREKSGSEFWTVAGKRIPCLTMLLMPDIAATDPSGTLQPNVVPALSRGLLRSGSGGHSVLRDLDRRIRIALHEFYGCGSYGRRCA